MLAAAAIAATLSGCLQSAIDANTRQLQDQQAQLDQLKQEVAALRGQRTPYSTAPLLPGACDTAVMAAATRKAGERMAAGDAARALGYYQDAASACPTSAEAQANLANAYETNGDRAAALQHYRIAAAAPAVSSADTEAVRKAKEALSRLGPPA